MWALLAPWSPEKGLPFRVTQESSGGLCCPQENLPRWDTQESEAAIVDVSLHERLRRSGPQIAGNQSSHGSTLSQ